MIVSIIGVGLIGGSIGLAIKKSGLKVKKVIGIGRNLERLKLAKKIGAVDEITTDINEGVKNADIVFVCLPVGLIAQTTKSIFPYCKKDAIITDVGSVKQPIVNDIEKFLNTYHLPLTAVFIGGHPIAGSEKTSVKYASKDLFENAVVVLTPTEKTDRKSLDIVKKLWEKMKAKVKIMSPTRHDRILAMTSHLPHAVAFALVNSADNFEFAGTGFKDTTRIASSDPEMWADIIFNNRTNVRCAIKRIKFELGKIEKEKTVKKLVDIFKKAKTKRDKIAKNNQTKTEHMFGNKLNREEKKLLNEIRILEFIKMSLKRRKISPSVREVADYFNMSVSTSHTYLKNLRNKKLIKVRSVQNKIKSVARGITKNKNRTNVRF
ncbi:MAG: hypothetical protein BWK68_00410 [Elusimicrobia bacterium A5]|nr:MAG: hypothetical protein BWK68_00410 [Elusimicrobia bacterium A5]